MKNVFILSTNISHWFHFIINDDFVHMATTREELRRKLVEGRVSLLVKGFEGECLENNTGSMEELHELSCGVCSKGVVYIRCLKWSAGRLVGRNAACRQRV